MILYCFISEVYLKYKIHLFSHNTVDLRHLSLSLVRVDLSFTNDLHVKFYAKKDFFFQFRK